MKVRKVAIAMGLLAVGCGGKKGTIELDLVLPALVNTLAGADKIEIIGGPDTGSSTLTHPTAATNSYSISFDQKPPKTAYNLVVEGLDSAGDIIAYGETPLITLNAVNQGPFGVWVGNPGTIATSPSALTSTAGVAAGATSLTGCNVTGLGGVIAGGDVAGIPVTTTYVYDTFTSAIIDTAALTTARTGAVCVPATAKGIVFGGTSTETPSLTALATGEAFDPTAGGAGQWVAVPGTTAAQAFPSLAILSDGTGLATGGFDSNGNASYAATAITAGSAITIGQATTAAMSLTSARVHHASAWMYVGGQVPGALLVGGLPVPRATNSTISEQYVNGVFASIPDGTVVPNLWNATATTLNAGAGVFIAGGGVDGGAATASAYYVTFSSTANAFVVTDYSPGAMAGLTGLTARKNHTATLVGDDILLCGGIGADGKALGSCDVISTNPTITFTKTINGLNARQNHVAIPLETGPVIFVGGDDGNGNALAGIDIYTPTMPEEAIVNTQNGAIIGTAKADGGT